MTMVTTESYRLYRFTWHFPYYFYQPSINRFFFIQKTMRAIYRLPQTLQSTQRVCVWFFQHVLVFSWDSFCTFARFFYFLFF